MQDADPGAPDVIDLRDADEQAGLELAEHLRTSISRERATAQALREYLSAASTP